ncbi:unnamed protein product [Arabis nemorensis]|uniref:Uncharacterized protein n=1 Tax=Arabis nemorensis TaxID=586526 RepID=A0A565CPN0_9BRAS|nr:unnamed protein product [Arabis nemorensis]
MSLVLRFRRFGQRTTHQRDLISNIIRNFRARWDYNEEEKNDGVTYRRCTPVLKSENSGAGIVAGAGQAQSGANEEAKV